MVVSLVKHLALQGAYHRKEDIAVLTPYLGQLRILRSKFAGDFDLVVGEKDMEEIEAQERREMLAGKAAEVHEGNQLRRGKLGDAIRIATVDNFQGEEAKIIVISLVRSNESHKCGFLRTNNRINVLLSRAQHGMYIIGDSETAREGSMWVSVIGMLERGGNIGPKLALQCPRHPDIDILVEKNEDFRRLAPEGGCTVACGNPLKCGAYSRSMKLLTHTLRPFVLTAFPQAMLAKCHAMLSPFTTCISPFQYCRQHKANHGEIRVQCGENCDRGYTWCRHPCPKRCFEDCGNCMAAVSTTGVILPCGHAPNTLFCYVCGWLASRFSPGHADDSTLSKNTTCKEFYAGRPSNAQSTVGIRWKFRVSAPRKNSPAKVSADRCCHADTNACASVSTAESRIPRSRRR